MSCNYDAQRRYQSDWFAWVAGSVFSWVTPYTWQWDVAFLATAMLVCLVMNIFTMYLDYKLGW